MIKLLAAKQQQQPPPRKAASESRPQGATQPSPGPYDGSASDCDSIEPRQLVSEKPADGLKQRFLDRLAEVLLVISLSLLLAVPNLCRGTGHRHRSPEVVKPDFEIQESDTSLQHP